MGELIPSDILARILLIDFAVGSLPSVLLSAGT